MYNGYADVVNETLFTPHAKEGRSRKIPKGRKRVAYRRMVLGLAFLGAYVVLSSKFNYGVTITPWFEGQKLWYRCAFYENLWKEAPSLPMFDR